MIFAPALPKRFQRIVVTCFIHSDVAAAFVIGALLLGIATIIAAAVH